MPARTAVRKVSLPISPGLVPSVRAEPQISNSRDGLAGPVQRQCAALMRTLAATHADDSSWSGSA